MPSAQLQKLRERMAERDIPAALVTQIDNVRWLTGFSGSSAVVLLTESDGVFITDSRYKEQAPEQVRELRLHVFASPTSAAQAVAEKASEMGLTRLAFESENVTVSTLEDWREKIPNVEWTPSKGLVNPLRMVKTPEEIAKIREACSIADACFTHVTRMIQPGIREYDIALDIEFFIRRQGAKLAFDVVAVSGPRSARPHGVPSERKLEKQDFVTLDFGANVDGYNSDLTRTVVIGEATDRHREVYSSVLRAQTGAIQAMKPGAAAKDIDALSRKLLAENNLDQYFGHGLGHGLGRTVHDVGSLSARSEDILEAGQVWTVEPGVYIEGFGGVRIEDDVVVTESGCEVLTHSPKALLELP